MSEGPYESLNLGRKSGDVVERVDENRRITCEAIGADVARLALNLQVHSNRVNRAVAGSRGTPGDALWTDEPGLPILVMTADCLPVALVRVAGGAAAVAVLHVGWKGLLAGIVAAGVGTLGEGELAAVIGPGIGACCYEVGEEVAASFRERFGDDVLHGRNLDLRTSAERALRAAGVERVDHVDRCTSCEAETFFSHRRDRGITGRQGVIAYVAG